MTIERTPVNVAVINSRLLLIVRINKSWDLLGGRPEGGEEDISCLVSEVDRILPGTVLKNYVFYKDLEGKTPDDGKILRSKLYLADFISQGRSPVNKNLGARDWDWISHSTDKPLTIITRLAVDSLYNDRYLI
jgi:hypothetical protein